MLRISTDFLIPDTPARSLRPGNCTRDREIGFVSEIMSSEERIGKCQQNSGRIQPKANGIRVNFIVGVTTLTFNDPDFKKREFCCRQKFGNPTFGVFVQALIKPQIREA